MLKLIWAANLVLLYSSLSCYSAAWLWNKPLTNQHFIKKGRNQESVLRVTVASELQTHLLAVILLFHRNTNIVNKWTYSWLSLIFCKKWANKGFNGLYTSRTCSLLCTHPVVYHSYQFHLFVSHSGSNLQSYRRAWGLKFLMTSQYKYCHLFQ